MKVLQLIGALEGAARSGMEPQLSLTTESRDGIERLVELLRASGADDLSELRVTRKVDDIASLIVKFAEVSRFSKQEWIGLAESNGIKLELNPRDSARDVMGKLARYLYAHPDALSKQSAKSQTTPLSTKSTKGRRKLAENLQETLTRLLDE